MKLQNMFKKNRKSYIPLKSERPEVPEGLLKKCNKMRRCDSDGRGKKCRLYLSEMSGVLPGARI